MIATGFSHAAGLALLTAGGVLAIGGARRLGPLAGLLPLPVLWLVGAGLAQFPLFPIQRPWSGTMWLLVLLVPLAFALGAAVAAAVVRSRARERAIRLPAALAGVRLRPLLLALLLLGLAELAHQFAGAGGVPLLSGNIDATRFAQPRGPTVLLVDLLDVVAVVALVRPPRLTAPGWRFELALGLTAIAALALQASRGSLLLPLATVAVARAMVWGIPPRRTLVALALAGLAAFCGLFYARVAQHPDRPFEHDLLHRVVPSRPLWERPLLPAYVALAPNFEVVRGLVGHFPTVEPFAHGAFSTVAFNRVIPGTRLTGSVSARITPPFTAPTFAGSLWADGGLALVWVGAALLGALNGALLTRARGGALGWRLTAAYAVVLTTFAIYDSFFTQYLDWLVIGPALLLVGTLAQRAPAPAGAQPSPARRPEGARA
ncbi:MAG: hypothetical protein JSS99_04910 [Actinobacteria bacterium]|nr:hypothetical protein [Actinomycetota bacterium]